MSEPLSNWLVVLGGSGEVIAAERGAPTSWRGEKLHESPGIPDVLASAVRRALAGFAKAPSEMTDVTVDVAELDASVRIVVLPAVGIRRMATDVRKLIAYAMTALERQARALDIGLSIDVANDVPASVRLDPEKTAWAVTALVGNSLRHVRRGTRMMPGGAIAVGAHFDVAARELVITVSDDGPGIPAEIAARLFTRVPGAPHATGVALTVVRDVVAAHGGSLVVTTSTADATHGTTITVRLPSA